VTNRQTNEHEPTPRTQAQSGPRISYDPFVHALRSYGIQFTDEAAQGLFSSVDANSDGVIDLNEFVHGLLQPQRRKADHLSPEPKEDYRHVKGMDLVNREKAALEQDMKRQQSKARCAARSKRSISSSCGAEGVDWLASADTSVSSPAVVCNVAT
jgi:hypothetical protein